MVVVEGPPALGKTEVAKAIANELDMKFVPGFSMDTYYINSYGYDLRELDYRVEHERVKTYDEKKFAQDPLGQDGGGWTACSTFCGRASTYSTWTIWPIYSTLARVS